MMQCADLGKIDLSNVRTSHFDDGVGSNKSFQLLFGKHKSADGIVYGNLSLTLGPNNTVTSTRGFDTYDFNRFSPYLSRANIKRNLANEIGRAVHGKGTSFKIYLGGSATIGN